jgi:hypothetical protein
MHGAGAALCPCPCRPVSPARSGRAQHRNHLLQLAAFAFCARAVGVDLGLAEAAALVPLILFTMLIPISMSGWGLREGAAAALLPLAGATASGGLAASVAFGLTFVASVLPGFMVLWLSPRATERESGAFAAIDRNGTIRRGALVGLLLGGAHLSLFDQTVRGSQ